MPLTIRLQIWSAWPVSGAHELKINLKLFSCKTVKLRFTKFIVEEFLASDNKTCRYDKVLISWTDYKGPTFEGKFIYMKNYLDGHFGSRAKNYPVFSLSSKNKFWLLYSAAGEFLWNTPQFHTDLSVQHKDRTFSAPKISQFKFHTKNPQFNTPLSSTPKTLQFNTAYIELFFFQFFFGVELRRLLNWRVFVVELRACWCKTEEFLALNLRDFWCWTEEFLVWNWGILGA